MFSLPSFVVVAQGIREDFFDLRRLLVVPAIFFRARPFLPAIFNCSRFASALFRG
ncbi:MAG: hypothetical protein ACRESR_06935 [Gammaproteobacteria bacterium]